MLAKIKEIFESIQGEGLLVGYKQIFVRFAFCNLHCDYCDTDYSGKDTMELSEEELFDKIKKMNADFISFTGGEPLLSVDFIQSFLEKYKKHLNKQIYLETNGILPFELERIIHLVDMVGMDIKIESATGEPNLFDVNEKFLEISQGKVFIKVVFTKDITLEEIRAIANLAEKYDCPIVLQPKTPIDTETPFLDIYDEFAAIYDNVRLIPQTHKVMEIS